MLCQTSQSFGDLFFLFLCTLIALRISVAPLSHPSNPIRVYTFTNQLLAKILSVKAFVEKLWVIQYQKLFDQAYLILAWALCCFWLKQLLSHRSLSMWDEFPAPRCTIAMCKNPDWLFHPWRLFYTTERAVLRSLAFFHRQSNTDFPWTVILSPPHCSLLRNNRVVSLHLQSLLGDQPKSSKTTFDQRKHKHVFVLSNPCSLLVLYFLLTFPYWDSRCSSDRWQPCS